MSNFVQTAQTRSTCAESDTLPEAKCENDSGCVRKPIGRHLNGYWTGRCLLSTEANDSTQEINMKKTSKGLCEYLGRFYYIFTN